MTQLGAIDYILLLGMLAVSMAIGIYYAWVGRHGTKEEFLMGGRQMSAFPVALSLMASFLSPIALLGWPAEVYSQGIAMLMAIVSTITCNMLVAEVFMPIYYKLKITSVNTYLSQRFGSNLLRVVTSITICIAMLPWLGVVLYSPSLVIQTTTGLSLSNSILLTGLAVTIYTSIGGLKAVVWTDVVQFTLMMLGIIVVIVKATWEVGSISDVFKLSSDGSRMDLFNFDFNIYMSNNVWMVVLGTFTIWAGGSSSSQMIVQRTCTLPTLAKAKKVVYISLHGFLIVNVLVTFLGMVLYALYAHCDPIASGKIEKVDQIVPYFVAESFGSNFPGIPGLFVACVCSASLSTLSSALNAMSALIWEDWLSKIIKNTSATTEVLITKIIAAVVGIVCILAAFLTSAFRTIFQAAYALSGAPNGPVFGVFLMGIFCPFVNATGALCGLLFGQFTCMFITTGGLLNPYDAPTLPTSIDGTDCKVIGNGTGHILPFSELKNFQLINETPEGMNKIFHVSHFFVPFVGLLTSLTVGMVVSLLTGGNRGKKIDRRLLHPSIVRLIDGKEIEIVDVNRNGVETTVFLDKTSLKNRLSIEED